LRTKSPDAALGSEGRGRNFRLRRVHGKNIQGLEEKENAPTRKAEKILERMGSGEGRKILSTGRTNSESFAFKTMPRAARGNAHTVAARKGRLGIKWGGT